VSKRREKYFKTVSINLDRERDFITLIEAYVEHLEEDHLLFPFDRKTAWKLVNKATGMFPHWFRHLRLTHLCQKPYNFRDADLQRFVGCKQRSHLEAYTHLNVDDIAERMK
jgi:hypothetical protein